MGMNLTVNVGGLRDLVLRAASIAGSRAGRGVNYESVMLRAGEEGVLSVSATDGELSYFGSCPAEVVVGGSILVSASMLSGILRAFKGKDMTLEGLEGPPALKLRSKGFKAELVGSNEGGIPECPALEGVSWAKVEAKAWSVVLANTMVSMKKDDARYTLNGLCLERGETPGVWRCLSTNAMILSMFDFQVEEGPDFIFPTHQVLLPPKGLLEMSRMVAEVEEPLEFCFVGDKMVMKVVNRCLVMSLMHGRFPDYKLIVGEDVGEKLELSRDLLIEGLRMADILSRGNKEDQKMRLELLPDGLSLESIGMYGGTRGFVEGTWEGGTLELMIKPDILLKSLEPLAGERICLKFKTTDKTLTITAPEQVGYKGVMTTFTK